MKFTHLGLSVSRLAILLCAIMAIQSGIAHAHTLYMGFDGVKTYDLASDSPIDESFVPRDRNTGFNAMLISGNTLYAVDNVASAIKTYDADTGKLLNPAFATGLRDSNGLAMTNSRLYVANTAALTVSVFDAQTGASISSRFIEGLRAPIKVATMGNVLFVEDVVLGTVATYDATTGQPISHDFIAGLNTPTALTLDGNILYIGSSNLISTYNASTGELINAYQVDGYTGMRDLAVSGNKLLIADSRHIGVDEFNALTGELVKTNIFPGSFFAYPTQSFAIAAIPEASFTVPLLLGCIGVLATRRPRLQLIA